MDATGTMGPEDQGLLDIAGARRPGDEIHGPGMPPTSVRNSPKASSMVGTMREACTTAMWVSGRRLTVAGAAGPDSTIRCRSRLAQKQPVMPTRSASWAPPPNHGEAGASPIPGGDLRGNHGFRPKPCSPRKVATAPGT